MRRICFYVPALSILLPAASVGLVGCSGTGSRLSGGVALPGALLVTDLDRKMRGQEDGILQGALTFFYFPAPSIFLSAASVALIGAGGTVCRLSGGVVSPRAALVTDLGKKMKGAGRWDTAGCAGSVFMFLPFPYSCPPLWRRWLDAAELAVD
tara:strand:- start:52 stop:510 length:459 start_codon:yes stop_codon:yes gene_type:complete